MPSPGFGNDDEGSQPSHELRCGSINPSARDVAQAVRSRAVAVKFSTVLGKFAQDTQHLQGLTRIEWSTLTTPSWTVCPE
jgi:hypothetical protein